MFLKFLTEADSAAAEPPAGIRLCVRLNCAARRQHCARALQRLLLSLRALRTK